MTNPPSPNEVPPQAPYSAAPGVDTSRPSDAGSVTAPPSAAKGLALAALIVGIVAFLTGLIPGLGLLLAIAAVTLGVIALVKKQSKALAITGVVLGAIALFAGLISTSVAGLVATRDSASTSEDAPTPIAPDPEPTGSEPDVAVPSLEVAETTPPTPSADGTVASPLPQPYVAEGLLGGEKYSLTNRIVDANANALTKQWNQSNPDAPAGFKYVVVELTMTGIDPDGVGPSLASFDLSLATGEGNTYDYEFIVFGDGMSSMSDGPTLYPGSSFTGYTAYVVPDSAQSFLIFDNGNFVSF